jgi:hypothetical protein
MRTVQLSLFIIALLTAGCIYYDPYPYGYPPPRYRRPHRVPPPSQTTDTDSDKPTPPGDQTPAPPDETPAPPSPSPKNQPEPPAESQKTSDAPTAAKGSRPGRVKSPFQPGREIDVSGIPSGTLAKDPNTGKVFRVP